MSEHWQDNETERAWVQQWRDNEAAWRRRSDRTLRLVYISLVGLNLGLGILAFSHYLDKQGWGYLLASGVHLCAGLYVGWRLRASEEETP